MRRMKMERKRATMCKERREKIIGRMRGRLAVAGITALSGAVLFPIPVLANTGKEADCICETKCTDESVNEDCPVCREDPSLCQGTETPAEEPVEAATEAAAEEEEPEGPLTPDGNMTLVDDYGDHETSGKQFVTLTTKDGNYFYLIIDRDDSGNETVHFLNQVDEEDLLSLLDDDTAKEYRNAQKDTEPAAEDTAEEASTAASEPEVPDPSEAEPEETKKSGTPVGMLVLLVLIGFGAIGVYAWKKIGKPAKKDVHPDPDADYDESGEKDYVEELQDEDPKAGQDEGEEEDESEPDGKDDGA